MGSLGAPNANTVVSLGSEWQLNQGWVGRQVCGSAFMGLQGHVRPISFSPPEKGALRSPFKAGEIFKKDGLGLNDKNKTSEIQHG